MSAPRNPVPSPGAVAAAFVSIVTPCFNSAPFIRETIESVAAQDYPHIEHIVMDAGSTDGTLAILAEYPDLIVHSEPDRGAADAINKGLRLAHGEYLTYLNADDVLLPGAISAAVNALAEDPSLAGVYGDASWINEAGATIGPYPGAISTRSCSKANASSASRHRFCGATRSTPRGC